MRKSLISSLRTLQFPQSLTTLAAVYMISVRAVNPSHGWPKIVNTQYDVKENTACAKQTKCMKAEFSII